MGNAISNTVDGIVNVVRILLPAPFVNVVAGIFPTKIDTGNIQGDIIVGLPKNVERFLFYQITDVQRFRRNLFALVPTISTAAQILHDHAQIQEGKRTHAGTTAPTLPLAATNIAFSRWGLNKLGKTQGLDDGAFQRGQAADIDALGDPRSPHHKHEPDWIPEFKEKIDLIILVTGDSEERIDVRVKEIEQIFGIGTANASLKQVYTILGKARPGDQRGHEHFGYKDGISQPALTNWGPGQGGPALLPGQQAVPSGVLLCRHTGDPRNPPRWTKDGSFLVFRLFDQLVPEFDDFLIKNPIVLPGLTPDKGSVLAGARMIGRWKSGAPLDLKPLEDDPDLGNDPNRNNHFDYSTNKTQDHCPFAAHMRKTNPRSDQPKIFTGTEFRRIWRQGISYGEEVSDEERRQGKTLQPRGLAFVCYASSIDNGFRFIQQSWSNSQDFPLKIPPVISGYDPITGLNGDGPRNMYDPRAKGKDVHLPFNFVVPKGGEYFFAPSIEALRNELALRP